MRMKALTIRQPWATLIALGEKQFETRSWQTKFRGQIAIHAGKSIDKEACEFPEIKKVINEHGINSYKDLPTGSVIATANITGCYKVIEDYGNSAYTNGPVIRSYEYPFGNYTEGRYAWKLDSVKPLKEPIQAKGQLSLWEWNGDSK